VALAALLSSEFLPEKVSSKCLSRQKNTLFLVKERRDFFWLFPEHVGKKRPQILLKLSVKNGLVAFSFYLFIFSVQ
jgi:hypothetical protein